MHYYLPFHHYRFERQFSNILINFSDPDSEQIILRGEQDKLGSALNVLFDKAHSEIDLNISAKSWIQRHLIGVKGSRLQSLQVNFPRKIEFFFFNK